jgi:DNA polymerase III subunit epsilon
VLFRSPAWNSVAYWALDLETGGLDARADPILAVGMVPVREGVIRLGEAWSSLVRPEDRTRITPDSIRAHQLVWEEVRNAPPIGEVLREVDRRIREGALLVHHQTIDVGFLRQAYRRQGMRWPGPKVVDTANLLVKEARRARFADPDRPDHLPSLQLSVARREHGLPDYQAHDALTDALAAAELFLVLRRSLGARRLRDVL